MELAEALAEGLHVLAPAKLQAAVQQHEMFLERFPRDRWPEMTLEEYALGTEKTRDSYCYALEWGTTGLGSIRGGTSAKHLIFQRRKTGEWYWAGDFPSVDAAWTALRAGYVQALELADAGRWSEIADIAVLAPAKVVKLKTLFLYYPDDILPVYSREHLRHYADRLSVDPDGELVSLNRRVLAAMRAVPELEALSGHELARLLYRWAPPPGWHTPAWVKIAPGEQASKWEECREGGFICVGWDDVEDLSSFDTEEEFRTAFAQAYPYNGNKSQVTRKARELWRLTQLKPGDRIVANKGTGEVVGIGTVTDGAYEWRPERSEYRHTVGVEWDEDSGQVLDPPVKTWATTTVLAIPKQIVERLTSHDSTDTSDKSGGPIAEPVNVEWAKTLERKKQVIFYGPPGTGKTRAARSFARWWLTKDIDLAGQDPEMVEALDDLLSYRGFAERAWWITANPSEWSWRSLFEDDFVGFRRGRLARNYDKIESGDVVVCYESTPTLRVVGLARVVAMHQSDDIEPLRLIPIRAVPTGPTWAECEADPVLAQSEPVKSRAQGTLFSLSRDEFHRILGLSGLTDVYLDRTPDDLAGLLTEVTFHASYSYEEFIEGYRPAPSTTAGLTLELRNGLVKRVARTAAADDSYRYVVLIDEINRANIPRVFGELMTVLEADKRGMRISLPTSGGDFHLPDNVYFIGTMNTADRSIRTLDAALRRRFAFIELMPDPAVLSGAVVDQLALDSFLLELNNRISREFGREKQVGHSYFMRNGTPLDSAEDFAEVVRLEIIPLLQELVFEDYGRLQAYLGKDLVNVEEQRLTALADDDSHLVAALVDEYQAQAADV